MANLPPSYDVPTAEMIADAPTMLRLLRNAQTMWIHNPNPPKGSVTWEISELLKKYPLPEEESGVLGTAADLIR